jgi:hypothetical protein
MLFPSALSRAFYQSNKDSRSSDSRSNKSPTAFSTRNPKAKGVVSYEVGTVHRYGNADVVAFAVKVYRYIASNSKYQDFIVP